MEEGIALGCGKVNSLTPSVVPSVVTRGAWEHGVAFILGGQ